MEQSPLQIRVTDSGSRTTYHAEWSTRKRGLLAQIIGGVISLILGLAILAFVFWLALFLFVVGGIVLLVGWIRFKWHHRQFKAAAEEFEHSFDQEVIEDAVVVEESDRG